MRGPGKTFRADPEGSFQMWIQYSFLVLIGLTWLCTCSQYPNGINICTLSSQYPILRYLQIHNFVHLHGWHTRPKQRPLSLSKATPFRQNLTGFQVFFTYTLISSITCECLLLYHQRVFLSMNKSHCSIKQTPTLRLVYISILTVLSKKKDTWNLKKANF